MLGANVEICVVGNKADMEKNRTVPLQEAETYAASVGAKHYSTSAKLNKGVDELFLDLSKRMLVNSVKNPLPPPPLGSGPLGNSQKGYGTGGTLKLGGDEKEAAPPPAGGMGCCGLPFVVETLFAFARAFLRLLRLALGLCVQLHDAQLMYYSSVFHFTCVWCAFLRFL